MSAIAAMDPLIPNWRFVMTATGILILHAIILCFQLVARRLFPSQHRAIAGTYFIFLPVGFGIFTQIDPRLTAVMVLLGVTYLLYAANKDAETLQKDAEVRGVNV